MHKHPRQSKRKILALRFFVYGIMTVATAIISIICILLVMGYQFDLSKRTVEQGGLVQLRSVPNGATIGIDGARLPAVTPTKVNITSGEHAVTMSIKGYRPWSKSVTVKPGQLLWLNYTRFVPESITTLDVREFPRLTSSLPSPDRESLLLQSAVDSPKLTLVDLRNRSQPRFSEIAIPAAAYDDGDSGTTHRFSLLEWDFGSRYVLVRHVSGNKTEYLRLDTAEPDRTMNISRVLGLEASQIHFAGTSGERYFALSGATVRQADIARKTISAPIASKVTHFEMYGDDTFAYSVKDADGYHVGLYREGRAGKVADAPRTQPPAVAVTEYFGKVYVALAQGRDVTIYADPRLDRANKPWRELEYIAGQVSWLDYSNNGRFLVAGTKDDFMSFDAELRTVHRGTMPEAREADRPFVWLDDYHVVTIGGSQLAMAEFDGSNKEFITRIAPGFQPTLDPDGEMLYSVARKATGAYVLQRSQMIID